MKCRKSLKNVKKNALNNKKYCKLTWGRLEGTNNSILLLLSENTIHRDLPSSWTGLGIEHRSPNINEFLKQIRPNSKWHRETLSEKQKQHIETNIKVVVISCCRHKATKHNKSDNHVAKCYKMYCTLTWRGLGGKNCSYYNQFLNILISKGYHLDVLALVLCNLCPNAKCRRETFSRMQNMLKTSKKTLKMLYSHRDFTNANAKC